MPIKLKKTDIENKVDNPKQGYKILGFDNTGTLVSKDSDGTYKPIVPVQEFGEYEKLNIISGLTIGYRLPGSLEGDYTLAQGTNVIASGYASSAQGVLAWSINDYSISNGAYLISSGKYSYAGGSGHNSAYKMESGGFNSFIHSSANGTSTLGTYADFSVIIGGRGHNIEMGADNSAILGGLVVTIDTPNTAAIVLNNYTANTIEKAVYVPRILLKSDNTYSAPVKGTIQWSGGTYNHFIGYTGSVWRNLDNNTTGGVSSVSTALSNEIINRGNQDASLSTALSSDISSSVSADLSLTTALSSEVSTTSSRDTSLSNAIVSGSNSLSSSLSGEISIRLYSDLSLSTDLVSRNDTLSTSISTVTSERISAEPANESALSVEISVRISRDSSLSTAISNSDVSLSTAITNEISTRTSKDVPLSSAIANEITDKDNADSTLSTNISTEISTKNSYDTTLSLAISTDITDRGNTDSSLQSGIGDLQHSNTRTLLTNNQNITASLEILDTYMGPFNHPNDSMGLGRAGNPYTQLDAFSAYVKIIAGRMFINLYYQHKAAGTNYRIVSDPFFACVADEQFIFFCHNETGVSRTHIQLYTNEIVIRTPGTTAWLCSFSYRLNPAVWQPYPRLDIRTGGVWTDKTVYNTSEDVILTTGFWNYYEDGYHSSTYTWAVNNEGGSTVVSGSQGTGSIPGSTFPASIGYTTNYTTIAAGTFIEAVNYTPYSLISDNKNSPWVAGPVFDVDNGYDTDWLSRITWGATDYDSGSHLIYVAAHNQSTIRDGLSEYLEFRLDGSGGTIDSGSYPFSGSLDAGEWSPIYPDPSAIYINVSSEFYGGYTWILFGRNQGKGGTFQYMMSGTG